MITKIAFIAHPTRDIDASKRFFGEALGLKPSAEYENAWVEYETPDGKAVALDTFSPQAMPSPSPYVAFESDDIAADVARLREHGATIIRDVWDNEDGEGRSVCKMAVVADPDGNLFMLHEIATWRTEG